MGNHAPFDHLAGMGLHGEGDASGVWSREAPDRHGVEQGHGLSPAAGRFPGTARSRAKGVQNHGARPGTAWFSGIRSRGCGAAHGPGGFAATVAGMPCGFGAMGGGGCGIPATVARKRHVVGPPLWLCRRGRRRMLHRPIAFARAQKKCAALLQRTRYSRLECRFQFFSNLAFCNFKASHICCIAIFDDCSAHKKRVQGAARLGCSGVKGNVLLILRDERQL